MTLTSERTERLAIADRVRHELARPLTAIRACAELLEDGLCGRLSEDQTRQIAHILENAVLLTREIDRLHAHFAQRFGRCETRRAPLVLRDACEATAREACERNGLAASAVTIAGDGGRLLADECALRAALGELLDNALRHGGAGVVVTLDETSLEHRITITDPGPGLPLADVERLFEPFVRGPETGAASAKGMGIGLPLCLAHARAMGGRVAVESRATGGSALVLCLPRS